MRAREAGIVYAPQGNKFYDGKRVFTFGRMSIYLDRNVIFAFNVETQQWAPIALDHLLSICWEYVLLSIGSILNWAEEGRFAVKKGHFISSSCVFYATL